MGRQEKFKHKIFLCPLASYLPSPYIVYLHYASSKPPHWQEHLLNHKEQHSPSVNKITP